jgi:hypothetical protein
VSDLDGKKSQKDIIVCDLDGTLALDDHRSHLLHQPGGKRDWDAYFALCHLDKPNLPIIELTQELNENGYEIYILTGRSETVKQPTINWLAKYRIPYSHLQMRRADSRTADDVLKVQWCSQLGISERVWLVLEDRDRVVKSWRDSGYTCLQVRPGNF